MTNPSNPARSASVVGAERLRVCGVALRRIAKLDVGPDAHRGGYTLGNSVRETEIVGIAQTALLDCWPDMPRLPEPMRLRAYEEHAGKAQPVWMAHQYEPGASDGRCLACDRDQEAHG